MASNKPEKPKYRSVSLPSGITDEIERLIEELRYWPSVGAFVREAALEKIREERRRLRELKEAEKEDPIEYGGNPSGGRATRRPEPCRAPPRNPANPNSSTSSEGSRSGARGGRAGPKRPKRGEEPRRGTNPGISPRESGGVANPQGYDSSPKRKER